MTGSPRGGAWRSRPRLRRGKRAPTSCTPPYPAGAARTHARSAHLAPEQHHDLDRTSAPSTQVISAACLTSESRRRRHGPVGIAKGISQTTRAVLTFAAHAAIHHSVSDRLSDCDPRILQRRFIASSRLCDARRRSTPGHRAVAASLDSDDVRIIAFSVRRRALPAPRPHCRRARTAPAVKQRQPPQRAAKTSRAQRSPRAAA
jgi:hypothetical protein